MYIRYIYIYKPIKVSYLDSKKNHKINNPYFPIFDFTLHTKNNLSAKKIIQIVDLSTNKNTKFS